MFSPLSVALSVTASQRVSHCHVTASPVCQMDVAVQGIACDRHDRCRRSVIVSNDMDAIQSILTNENLAILLAEKHRPSAIQVDIEKTLDKDTEMAKKGKERAENDTERMERQIQEKTNT